jgi:hypothetical protein
VNLQVLKASKDSGEYISTFIDHPDFNQDHRYSFLRMEFIPFGRTFRMLVVEESKSVLRKNTLIRFGKI